MEAVEREQLKPDPASLKRQLRERGICVIIPTYNNVKTVREVVRATLDYCADVIVVDDGCTDGSKEVLQTLPHITLVSYAKNRGKGYALKQGFLKALEMGFAYAITLDADGQHYPADIPLFLEANRRHPGSLIIGSRQLAGVERSKGSRFANQFSNFWFCVQTGCALPDTQTGYRLYPLRKLPCLSILTSKYEAELELLVFCAWHGVKLVPISVRVYYPSAEERVSHFRPALDFGRITLLNTLLCLLAIVYGLPLRFLRQLMVVVRTLFSLLFFLFFSCLVFTPYTWIRVKLSRDPSACRRHLHMLIYKAVRFVMIRHHIPGTTFRAQVDEPLDFDQPRIIICNHQSHLDLMCQLVFTPKVVFLTNGRIWRSPFYGLLIRSASYLSVSDGLDAILPQLRSLVASGYSVAAYPEGTRSPDCSIGRFHKGPFYLAQQLHLEVLPMYLYGPGKVLPKHTYHLRKGPLYVEVGHPLTEGDLRAMGDLRMQANTLRRHYVKKYEEIANKIEQYV